MAEHTRSLGVVAALVIAAGLAAGGFAVSLGLERFRTADRTVSVKGLAEKDVEGDFAVWPLGFRRGGNDFGAVQRALSEDRDRVVVFLKVRDSRMPKSRCARCRCKTCSPGTTPMAISPCGSRAPAR